MPIRPVIYTVCDPGYRDTFADGFLNSARAAGHRAEIFCDEKADNWQSKFKLLFWRFQLMPQLLRKYGAVLMVDIDSVIRAPIEIEPEYELGLFLRPSMEHDSLRALGCIYYCTDRAVEFATALAEAMTNQPCMWMIDQDVLWKTYQALGHRFRIKEFDQSTIGWEHGTKASILTGKGASKREPWFMDEVSKWSKVEDFKRKVA